MKPAFFVDGHMELKILKKLGVKTKVVRTNLNGKKVKITAIAKKISSDIRALNGRYSPLIILIDREGREETADEIIQKLKAELHAESIEGNVIVGVADRMIENWILADWETFVREIEPKPKKDYGSFVGKRGKSIVKKYMPSYQETTDGVRLFCKSRSSVIRANSDSFNKFISQIMELNYDCYWLNR